MNPREKIKLIAKPPAELSELEAYVQFAEAFLKVHKLFLRLGDAGGKILGVKQLAATRTAITLGFEPDDRFAEFLAAFRASDFHALAVKKSRVRKLGRLPRKSNGKRRGQ